MSFVLLVGQTINLISHVLQGQKKIEKKNIKFH